MSLGQVRLQQNSIGTARRRHVLGFSLLELLITVSVAVVGTVIAVPLINNVMGAYRLRSAVSSVTGYPRTLVSQPMAAQWSLMAPWMDDAPNAGFTGGARFFAGRRVSAMRWGPGVTPSGGGGHPAFDLGHGSGVAHRFLIVAGG